MRGAAAAAVALTLGWAAAAAADRASPEAAEEEDDDDDDDDVAAPPGARDTGFIGKRVASLEVDDCGIPPALDADALRRLASEHYARAEVLYNERGDYEGAIREFVASYCLIPHYLVLRSIGQAYERMLEYERAVAYLERHVAEVPDDAANAAELRRSIAARAQVLRNLPAQVQVTTTPPGAIVTFTDELGVRRNRGRVRPEPYGVPAGRYVMTVELPGHEPERLEIEAKIGKPYSYYFPLRPLRGGVVISTDPPDARIFVDQRLVGIGRYQDELPGGTYEVTVEAPGRLPETRRIEVRAGRGVDLEVRLPPPPDSGRTQLLVGSSIAGGLIGSLALGVFESGNEARGGLGFLGGVGLGLVGGYLAIPDDISVGSSSYILTASLVGMAEGALITSLFIDPTIEDDGATIGTAAIGGMALGAAFGAVTAGRFDLDAGDAALLNSGALWGAIGGGLFAVIFESRERVSQGLVLGGMNLGLVTGALLGRQVEYSRRHVALIDLAGLAGMGLGVAAQAVYDDATGTPASESGERTAHFALAGMALGLTVGAVLTRDMDVRRVGRLTPVIGTGTDAAGANLRFVGLRGDL